jgi:putative ABC transport system permease protein
MVPISYNTRSLFVRKSTTFAALGGIAVVVFVIASSMMLVSGIKTTLGAAGSSDRVVILRAGAPEELNSQISVNDVNKVLVNPSIKRLGADPNGAGEFVTVGALKKVGTGGISNVQFRGTTDAGLKFRPQLKIIEGAAPRPGTAEAMVGVRIRGRFEGLSMGQTFELTKNREIKVVGVFEDGGSSYESEVFFDRDVLVTGSGRSGMVSSVRAQLTSASAFDAFKANIEADKAIGLQVIRETDYYEAQSEGLSFLLGLVGTIVAVFCSFGAMIGATITMYGSVANRRKEIGTLRALGFGRFSILMSFLLESIILCVLGGIVGAVASLSMRFVKLSMLNPASWSEIVIRFEPTPRIIVFAVGCAIAMGVMGGFLPAVRAARVSPLQAIRN